MRACISESSSRENRVARVKSTPATSPAPGMSRAREGLDNTVTPIIALRMAVSAFVSLLLTLWTVGVVLSCRDKDVQMMARELEALDNLQGLAGWMDINFSIIRQNCASSLALAECYRGGLVRSYCDKTGLSSQQVAAEIATILERDMNNKRIAQHLRQLDFSQSSEGGIPGEQVCDPMDSVCLSATPVQESSSSNWKPPQNSKIISDKWLALEPSARQLSLIKYTGTDGEEQSFRLISEVQNRCQDLGTELGVDSPTLSGLKNTHRNPPEFCKEVFQTWIDRGMNVTWERLLEALTDIQLGGIAKRLRAALDRFFQDRK